MYGSDLLRACALTSDPGRSALTAGGWRWVGRESCLGARRTCVATCAALRSALLTVEERVEASGGLVRRSVPSAPAIVDRRSVTANLPLLFLSSRLDCVRPPAVAPPPHVYAHNPPVHHRVEQKSFTRRLRSACAPHRADIHQVAAKRLLHVPDLQLMQMDSGESRGSLTTTTSVTSSPENLKVIFFFLGVCALKGNWRR